jgi:hypothetical protein
MMLGRAIHRQEYPMTEQMTPLRRRMIQDMAIRNNGH